MKLVHRYKDCINIITSRPIERQALLAIKRGFLGFLRLEGVDPRDLIELYICMFSYYNTAEIERATGLEMSGQLSDYLELINESIKDFKLDAPILRAAVIAAATGTPMVAAWGEYVGRARELFTKLGAIHATNGRNLIVFPPRIVNSQIRSAIIAALPQPIYEEILEHF